MNDNDLFNTFILDPLTPLALDLFVHSNPNREAARRRWPWEEREADLPYPPTPTYAISRSVVFT